MCVLGDGGRGGSPAHDGERRGYGRTRWCPTTPTSVAGGSASDGQAGPSPEGVPAGGDPRLARWVERKLRAGVVPGRSRSSCVGTAPMIHAGGRQRSDSRRSMCRAVVVSKKKLTEHPKSWRTSRRRGNGPAQIPDRCTSPCDQLKPRTGPCQAIREGDLAAGTGYCKSPCHRSG